MSGRDLDLIEREYEQAIERAAARGDNDRAYELTCDLRYYRDHLRLTPPESGGVS